MALLKVILPRKNAYLCELRRSHFGLYSNPECCFMRVLEMMATLFKAVPFAQFQMKAPRLNSLSSWDRRTVTRLTRLNDRDEKIIPSSALENPLKSPREPYHSGKLVVVRKDIVYQHPFELCDLTSCNVLVGTPKRSPGESQVRQHYGGCVHKSPRRNAWSLSSEGSRSDSVLG